MLYVQFTYVMLFLYRWYYEGAKPRAAEDQRRSTESQDVSLQATATQAALQTG